MPKSVFSLQLNPLAVCVAIKSAGLGRWDITFQSCVVEASNGAMLALSFYSLLALLEGLLAILEPYRPGRLRSECCWRALVKHCNPRAMEAWQTPVRVLLANLMARLTQFNPRALET